MRTRIVSIVTLVILLVLAGIIFFNYFYVFGEGAKAGVLNQIVKKGNVFKTYEGRLIQTGLRSQVQGNIQSNEFSFSVTDAALADSLMRNSGKTFNLHYKEYKNPLPWRGYSRYIVDQIISVENTPTPAY